jgi:hypothetical protein
MAQRAEPALIAFHDLLAVRWMKVRQLRYEAPRRDLTAPRRIAVTAWPLPRPVYCAMTSHGDHRAAGDA